MFYASKHIDWCISHVYNFPWWGLRPPHPPFLGGLRPPNPLLQKIKGHHIYLPLTNNQTQTQIKGHHIYLPLTNQIPRACPNSLTAQTKRFVASKAVHTCLENTLASQEVQINIILTDITILAPVRRHHFNHCGGEAGRVPAFPVSWCVCAGPHVLPSNWQLYRDVTTSCLVIGSSDVMLYYVIVAACSPTSEHTHNSVCF